MNFLRGLLGIDDDDVVDAGTKSIDVLNSRTMETPIILEQKPIDESDTLISAKAYNWHIMEDPVHDYERIGIQYFLGEPYNMIIFCIKTSFQGDIIRMESATEPRNTYKHKFREDARTYKLYDVKISKRFVDGCVKLKETQDLVATLKGEVEKFEPNIKLPAEPMQVYMY
jgi:hypothetical protein